MLSPAQLSLIRQTISNTIFNREVTIQDASGAALDTEVLCYIDQEQSDESLNGQGVMNTPPVDATLKIERNDLIKEGNKILVTKVNGSIATDSQAAVYMIGKISDLDGIGIIQSCALYRESGVVG